ncbi:HAMP domain-containing histidine kinase, partial [Amycolatopsis sp. H6(2020)]|nr:HAMP domain-containing histidine kinase [Amycolatopsis sp. H6(2020)]
VDRFSGQGFTVPGVGGGTQWRIKPFSLSGTDKSMIVASPLNRVEQTVALVGMLTLAFGLATLLAAIALGWVLVTRAFEPLARVERTAARIAAGDLSQRIERYNPRTELGRLSMSLNVMLTRIEEAFDARKRSEVKMRRFVGDASHELRTPLVTIRGYSELYRHGALQSEEDIAKAMSRIEAESVRMGRLVEDLLMLARLDENRPGESQRVDLLELAQDAADDAEASAQDREVRVVGLEDGPA